MNCRNRVLRLMRAIMPCMTTILLTACGGGSGGSSSPSPTSYAVSATAGTGGSISPSSATVNAGGTTQFTVTADSGYGVSSVTGCGGTLFGTTYTTGSVNADCTVTANFAAQYEVTTTAGTGGTISPSSATVNAGGTTQFIVTANSGYAVSSVTGCGGTLSGNDYVTGTVNASCTVTVSFATAQYEVTTVAGTGGSISPGGAAVNAGGTTQFTVTANSGYALGSVTGCGNGTLSGTTYTTGPITANCTLTASFAPPSPPSVDASAFQINSMHNGAVIFSSVTFPTAPTWNVNVGGTPSYALIVNGLVFITVQLSSGGTYPTYTSELLALDQKTGATVWGPIALANQAGAAYDNGRVFAVAAGTSTGLMQAYDAGTGKLDWSTLMTGQYFFSAPPTALNGFVYATGAESGGTLYALDETTGAIVWTGSLFSGGSIDPAVTASGVYTAESCAALDFAPTTGTLLWSQDLGCSGGEANTPVVANSLVYWPNSGSYDGITLNAASGNTVGVFTADDPPAVTATTGYFLQGGTLRGLSLSTNTIEWSFTGDGSLTGSPIAVNQYVIIGSSSGNLYAVDGSTGAQVWTQQLGAAVDAHTANFPVSSLSAGDGLLVVPAGTHVIAYTLSTNP
jgi:outer membrane protein assembly factor BamB